MENKFTPGPWEIVAGDDYYVEAPGTIITPKRFVRPNLEYPAICKVVCEVSNQTADCGEANANLISAAPDLLEFARAERAIRNGDPPPWERDHDCDWCGGCVAHLTDIREAAIAKAEGRDG